MGSFVKQFCFPNDDEHRRYLAYLDSIGKQHGESASWAAYQAIKKYVDVEIKFVQSELDFPRIESEQLASEKLDKQKQVNSNVFCKECGASEVDSEGYVIHGVDCSETQRIVNQWGSREAWKQWVRSQKKDGSLR